MRTNQHTLASPKELDDGKVAPDEGAIMETTDAQGKIVPVNQPRGASSDDSPQSLISPKPGLMNADRPQAIPAAPPAANHRFGRWSFGVSMLPPLVALALQLTFWSYLQPYAWVSFYPAVFLSSWIGGLSGGLAATFLSTGLVIFFFIPPEYSFAVADPRAFTATSVFMGMGILFSFFHDRLRKAHRLVSGALASVRTVNDQLETRVRERTAELERMNRLLRESEELFSKAFQLSPDCMTIVRQSDRTVLKANEALCRLWGSTANEVVGRPALDFTTWTNETERLDFMQKLQDEGECLGFETTLSLGEGRLVPFSLSSRAITLNGEACVLTVMHDITERRQAEAASRAITAIVESSDDAIIGKDLGSIITSWNPAAEKIFGYPAGEMVGTSIMRIIPPERQAEEKRILAQIARGESVIHFETVRVKKGGQPVDVSVTISPLKDAAGRVIGASKIARDITERKQVETALLASRAKLDAAFGSMTDAVFISDAAGRFVEFNEAFATFHKFGTKEECAKTLAEYPAFLDVFMAGGERAPLEQWAVSRALRGETVQNAEYTLRRKDTGETWVGSYSFAPIRDRKGVIVGSVCVGRDVTAMKKAEATLRESEERMRLLVTLMPDAMFINQDQKVVFINQRGLQLWRAERAEQILGRSPLDLFHPHWHEKVRQRIARILSDGSIAPIAELESVALDGTVVPVETTATLFSYGGRKAIQVVVRDITERKQAEAALRESEERFRTMANSIPQLAWIARADGFIHWYNQRWYDYTGATPEQMEGWGWQSVHDPKVLPTVLENWKGAIAAGRPFEMEFPLRRADGQFRDFLTRGQPLKNASGQVVQWFGTNTDIEALKQAEEKVNRLNLELEQRVHDRTAQLEAANKELEAFSYSVSHDLRAPLRAVDGFSQAVLEDFSALLPEEGRRHLQTIRGGAQRMGALIDDLLSFARLSRLEMKKRPVDMAGLVREAMMDLGSPWPDRQVEIRLGELPAAAGDPVLLKQLWLNLIANALKYSGKRTPAVIEIGCEEKAGERIYSIRDNGTGFDMRYAGKLFGVFQRLHRAEEYEGTGVGLAIVQRVVHRHGGRVWADAVVDGGATFYFTLNEAPQS